MPNAGVVKGSRVAMTVERVVVFIGLYVVVGGKDVVVIVGVVGGGGEVVVVVGPMVVVF